MAELMKILDKCLQGHFERAVERGAKRKDEDYDEVGLGTMIEGNRKKIVNSQHNNNSGKHLDLLDCCRWLKSS